MSDLLYKFYEAGYEGRRYPVPLNRISRNVRYPVRKAYSEGKETLKYEWRLSHVLYGTPIPQF